MSREIFTPPASIETKRLIIRLFENAKEARACYETIRNDPVSNDPSQFYIRDNEDITKLEQLGYYKHSQPIFKDYGIFLRQTGSFIGVVTMTPKTFEPKLGDPVGILSDHARGILSEYQGLGFGGEVLTGIINHLLPKVGQYVIVDAEDLDLNSSDSDSEEESDSQVRDRKNESNDNNEINNTDLPTNQYPYLAHVTTVDFTNFPSIFSNLKAGMGINMIRRDLLVLNYPPEESDLDTELMKNMFKTLSTHEKQKTEKSKAPELEKFAKDTLIHTILSIEEPQTILYLGHYLAREFGIKVKEVEGLAEQLRKAFTYINEHQYSPFNEDGTCNLYYGNKVYYEFNDPIYREVMQTQDSAVIGQDSSCAASVDLTDLFNQLDLG